MAYKYNFFHKEMLILNVFYIKKFSKFHNRTKIVYKRVNYRTRNSTGEFTHKFVKLSTLLIFNITLFCSVGAPDASKMFGVKGVLNLFSLGKIVLVFWIKKSWLGRHSSDQTLQVV